MRGDLYHNYNHINLDITTLTLILYIYIYINSDTEASKNKRNAWIKRRKEQQILTKQANHHRITKKKWRKTSRHVTGRVVRRKKLAASILHVNLRSKDSGFRRATFRGIWIWSARRERYRSRGSIQIVIVTAEEVRQRKR
jgi:hypothetical protein